MFRFKPEKDYIKIEDGFGSVMWVPKEETVNFCRNLLRAKYGLNEKWKSY